MKGLAEGQGVRHRVQRVARGRTEGRQVVPTG